MSEAILAADDREMEGELGDLIMHVVFYAQIGRERGSFNITSVLNRVCDKLVHRHPHIYGDVSAATADEVKRNWEQIKLKEGKKSVLEGVPASLPALIKAARMQEKARGVGFDWRSAADVWAKVEEEQRELHEAIAEQASKESVEEEFGDLLFSLVNYARFAEVNPEDALERCNRKFKQRFQFMERRAADDGKMLSQLSIEEMEALWQRAKIEGVK